MDYNTDRDKLRMPEYGRSVQQMVEHCKSLESKEERTRCAKTIIKTMAGFAQKTTSKGDFEQKMWNHLAAIANYELDIDYPVEIERMDGEAARPNAIPYPRKSIRQRNYGAVVEAFTNHLKGMDDDNKQRQLGLMIANHMKRDLCNWSTDSMSDEKVVDDMARYTDGKIVIDLSRERLISDGELLSNKISTSVKKKKKK